MHDGVNRARFWIIRAVDQALNARVHQGSGTHRARLNCSKQFAGAEAMVTNDCARLAQGDDFGVRGRVVIGEIAIPAAGDDPAIANNNGADGNFSGLEGPLCGGERLQHEEFVGRVVRRWLVGGHRRSSIRNYVTIVKGREQRVLITEDAEWRAGCTEAWPAAGGRR